MSTQGFSLVLNDQVGGVALYSRGGTGAAADGGAAP